jgi:predicted HicB family RNase H-like nuclease
MQRFPVRVSLTVPKDTKARWKEAAKAQGISLSEWLRRATSEDLLKAQ